MKDETVLRSFLRVARVEHLGEAADQLGITQPTLSRRIATLERSLGAELFDRAGRGIRLNERGRAYLPHAEAALGELDAGRARVQRLMDPGRGTVRLDFIHSLGTWLVPDLLRAHRQVYPHATVRLHQGPAQALVRRVLADEADLALVGPKPEESAPGGPLEWLPLRRQRLALAFPEDHPGAAEGGPIAFAEIEGEPVIAMLPGYGTRIMLDRLSERWGVKLRIVFESMELTTVSGLVTAGLGVALLPLDDPFLVPQGIVLRPLDPPVYRGIGMVWRRDAAPAPPVDAFREMVVRGAEAAGVGVETSGER
ncbi:LysR family transcriptional regulator [Corynebacterium uropygiale]|uniref:LysR family transcriptional regulator n=1 Tax=Corynebacterium uropygiale TaxID=1775911 RepID=A0A9X1U832_9CORY|nr:LysR family transcriptional regulator [Corynebacterium uropygiale]MCF4007387.1 LysR family transcriptional regulator [Corynebacterium uropygiale]